MKKKNSHLFQVALAAAVTTLTTLFAENLSINSLKELFELFKNGLPLLLKEVGGSDFILSFPVLPIVIAWLLIGIIAYLNYYFLSTFYSEIHNYLVVKFFFVGNKEGNKPSTEKKLRMLIRTIVVVAYTGLFLVFLVALFPLGEILRQYVFSNTFNFVGGPYQKILSYLILYLYWYVGFGMLGIIIDKFRVEIETEEFEEEHEPV